MKNKFILFEILLLLNYAMPIDYYNQIQPLFDANCISCHDEDHNSGLDLTDYENLMSGGDSGAVIIQGNHAGSTLWQLIDEGPPDGMPSGPGANRLDQGDIDLIASWIDAGATLCDADFIFYDDIELNYENVSIQDDGTCFYALDLEALHDVIVENDFENISNSFELGTQTWNDGRLRFLVAGYYFNGVEEPIHTVPESIGNLTDLRKLYLEWNQITVLPDNFSNLTALVQLYISNNQLITLPENFGNLENLFILDLGYNQINYIPQSIINIDDLGYLWLFNNQLTELPENFCDLELNWNEDDGFGSPYFAIGGNMLCENVPECVANSDHLNTSLEQYYYSLQITECQDCECGDGICNGCEDEETCNDCNLIINNNENIEFQISNIYPNPFNPLTNIQFFVNKAENITISIFDLHGNLIDNLINNQKFYPGYHNIIWNAKTISSGIYFVNISNGIISNNQKIIFQK